MNSTPSSKPLNVLYLIRTWAFGGSHTIILLLMQHLPRDKYHVVCVPFETPSGADEAFIREAQRRGLAVADDRIPWHSRLNWTHARCAIDELIGKHNIDLIHAHDTHSVVLVGVGRNSWPCACVASSYGWWNSVFPLRRRAYQWAERCLALPNFERVITVSEHMRGKILRGGHTKEDRVRVIHTGLDLTAFAQRASAAEARKRFGIPRDACVVGTVSRVSPEKGHCHLLDAVGHLLPRYPQLHCLIVGEGPSRPSLEAQAAQLGILPHVSFTGFVDDLTRAWAAMDIFAQPSILEEGLPTSVLEAQAFGLPVVASDIGGTKDTLLVGTTGFLAAPRDAGSLADVLAPLLGDPARRLAMGEAAREWIRGSFTLEHMVEQVGQTYQEAIDLHARSRRSGERTS